MSAQASSSSAPKKGKKSKSRDVEDAPVEDEEVVNKNKRHRKDKRQSSLAPLRIAAHL